MADILNKYILPKLEIFQNQWVILSIVGGVIVIVVFVLVLVILRKRRSKKGIVSKVNTMNAKEPPDKWPEENYEFITKRIMRVRKKYKSILFASVEQGALPITIPVHVAIALARDKKRCLLIDLDLRRDAIAKAFEIETEENSLRPKAVRTEFENLWVWPAHNFAQLKQMNIKLLTQKALEKFDFVLMNAPSLANSPDCKQIISTAQAAFICTRSGTEVTKLAELLEPSDCVVIGAIQIPS